MNTFYANKNFTKSLSKKVAESLTLNDLVTLISDVITDPSVEQELIRVVGKKGENKLDPRKATALTAKILGYENEHVMASKTDDLKLYTVVHNHEYSQTAYQIVSDSSLGEIDPEILPEYLNTQIDGLDFEADRNESIDLFEVDECNAFASKKEIPFISSVVSFIGRNSEGAPLEVKVPVNLVWNEFVRDDLKANIAEQLKNHYSIKSDFKIINIPVSKEDPLVLNFGSNVLSFFQK